MKRLPLVWLLSLLLFIPARAQIFIPARAQTVLNSPFNLCAEANSEPPLLGNPDGATCAETGFDDKYLVKHTTYTLSYDSTRGAANWVFWHLDKSDLVKNVDTTRNFRQDPALPKKWRIPANVFDTTNTGIEQGHMCPAADRTDTEEKNKETNLMSNIQPQTIQLNQGPWKYLEEYTRSKVNEGKEAYVYAGCYGSKEKVKKQILPGRIVIPEKCFKIVLLLPEGENDIQRISAQTADVIAVIMPNSEGIKEDDWRKYIKNVDFIEDDTESKFDFFKALSPEVEAALELKIYDGGEKSPTVTPAVTPSIIVIPTPDPGRGSNDIQTILEGLAAAGVIVPSALGLRTYLRRRKRNFKVLLVLLEIDWYLRAKLRALLLTTAKSFSSSRKRSIDDQNTFSKDLENLENKFSDLLKELIVADPKWAVRLRNTIDLGQIEHLDQLDDEIQKKPLKAGLKTQLRQALREKTVNLIKAMLEGIRQEMLFATGQSRGKNRDAGEKMVATAKVQVEGFETEFFARLDKESRKKKKRNPETSSKKKSVTSNPKDPNFKPEEDQVQ